MATKKTTTKKSTKTVKKSTPKTTVKVENLDSATTESRISRLPRLKLSRKLLVILVIVVVLAGLAYLTSKYLIVAWVDGKPITRVEYYQNLENRYGKDLREQMIAEKLIVDEAQKRGISVSSQEIQTEIQKFEQQQGGADKLNQVLQMQGLTRDEFNKLVRLQLLRQKMFGEAPVSDDEVNKYIEANKDQFSEVTDQIKAQVKDQLKQQKVNDNFQNWLQQALQSNRVQRT